MATPVPPGKVMICIPCLLVGGTEVHTIHLARALISGGYRVFVCVYYEYDAAMVRTVEATGAEVNLWRLDRSDASTHVIRTVRLFRTLWLRIRQLKPDFVHVQYMTPGLAPLIVAKLLGVPHVLATIHVTSNHYKRPWVPREIGRRLCDVMLCVSQVAEQSFFGNSALLDEAPCIRGPRHFTIPNCVDLAAVDSIIAEGEQSAIASRLNPQRAPLVGIVGRLNWHKGHELLLRALVVVHQHHPLAQLICVGDGPERGPLESLASSLKLSNRVIFTGRMPQADVFRHISLMDVVAMPSRPGLEGFGLAAAEAMAMSKPLVASDVDGLAEVVGREDEGVLVPPENVPALADAIVQLLSNPQRRRTLGAGGRRRVERQFATQQFSDMHLALYASLAGSARAALRGQELAAASV
jgi:glycosyltransferase involved in cell wall biosynthesis